MAQTKALLAVMAATSLIYNGLFVAGVCLLMFGLLSMFEAAFSNE